MSQDFQSLTTDQRSELLKELETRLANFKAQGLALDMTRGKPAPEQLDLAVGLLDLPGKGDFKSAAGIDTRNYGGLEGLPEMRTLFGEILGVPAQQTLVGGNSSLTLMHDTVWRALSFGVPGGKGPWQSEAPIKFICPVPGYDRHFALCEHFGIELINVDMQADGPDTEAIARLVASDSSIKGMWLVPRYSNPTGASISAARVDALASMQTAAADFRIFWDNAYAEHHLTDQPEALQNIYDACATAGHPDRVLMFASTSKISFAGAGLAAMAASPANIAWTTKHMALQSIGPDKVNQLRHARFFPDIQTLRTHMQKHAAILKPKFQMVQDIFEAELTGSGIASWTQPQGGYFVSLDVPPGCATRVVALAAECGVKLTAAGATFPYKKDPRDCNLRIAPSLPAVAEIETAMQVVACCIKIAALQQLNTARA